MAQNTKKYKLNSGAEIPAVGLGTWQSKPNEVAQAVEAALATGYRHIDTAAAYGNEKEVGAGIKASGVPRDQIWLTTKLNNPSHDRVAEAVDQSLENPGTDYVDLYLYATSGAFSYLFGTDLMPKTSALPPDSSLQSQTSLDHTRSLSQRGKH